MKRSLLRPKTTSSTAAAAITITTERKIENATEGSSSSKAFNFLHNRVLPANRENALTICDYISSLKSEINPSDRYRNDTIIILCKFSIFIKNAKLFKEVTREDVLILLRQFSQN